MAAPPERTLKVKLNYTGAGTVDEKHKIYVLVLDADPFSAEVLAELSARPATPPEPAATGQTQKTAYILARQGAAGKDQTLVFTALPASPVYVVAFYDKSGSSEGRVDPASGSPMGLYGTAGKPQPIPLKDGQPVEIVLTFGDSSATP